jgi:CheY-like chemotaxis protein
MRPASENDRMMLRFEVEDTGIGIAREDHERIFKPFEQVANGRTPKGTGLGLAISRQFVELMGGSIEVDSEPGKGSCFRLEIPVDRAHDLKGAVTPKWAGIPRLESGQPEYRILVVDDEPENRTLLERVLRNAGFQVRVAESGQAAVETYRDWRPQFIWMDVRMPLLDGIEATQRIRALEGGQAVKIAAVTASASESQRDEVLAAGLDDYVRKPYSPDEIFDCMARHLGLKYRGPEHAKSGEQPISQLSSDAIAALPAALRSELRDAVVSLDLNRVLQTVEKVTQQDAALGSALANLAKSYSYTPILLAVDRARERSSATTA